MTLVQTQWSFCLKTSHGRAVKDKSCFMRTLVIWASRMSLLMLEQATAAVKVWQCRTLSTLRTIAWAFCRSLWKAQKRLARIKNWPSRLLMTTWKRNNGLWGTKEYSMTTASPQLTRSLKREQASLPDFLEALKKHRIFKTSSAKWSKYLKKILASTNSNS